MARMIFALDYLNQMERKYPGVLDSIASQPDVASCFLAMAQLGVNRDDYNLMISLRAWQVDKVIYCFEREIAVEVMNQTESPNYEIPISLMKCLPYPCFAVQTVPFDLLDPQNDNEVGAYTGNVFIWLAEGQLISTWEIMKKFKKLNYKKRTIRACSSICQNPVVCYVNCAGDILEMNAQAQKAADTIQG